MNAMTPKVTPLDEADLYGAVYDFVLAFARPELPPDAIYRGWRNRSALPAMSEEYAVISVLGHYRRGATVERFSAPSAESDGELELTELVEADVQIDLCSNGDAARRRAQCLETAARSTAGCDFFAARGVGCLYATDVRDISFEGDSNQFVRRCMTTLRLSFPTGVKVAQDWFAAVKPALKNVDVYFPPEREK